jgi:hypothetical protein
MDETQTNLQTFGPCNEFTGRPELGTLVKSKKVAVRQVLSTKILRHYAAKRYQ